jgi:Domain of unknown function (DUF4372)
MNTEKYVFAQGVSILDANDFKKCVDKYKDNYKVKDFTCWHQLLCMMFGQLTNRESLNDLVLCLQSQRNKWHHLGIGNSISKSNLAYVNEKRNWQIFADFAYLLIAEARTCITPNPDLQQQLNATDDKQISTTDTDSRSILVTKAIVKVARKLLSRIRYVWLSGEPYQTAVVK